MKVHPVFKEINRLRKVVTSGQPPPPAKFQTCEKILWENLHQGVVVQTSNPSTQKAEA